MRIVPFTPAHAAEVAGFATSATEARWWCGSTGFPVPAALVRDWQQDADVSGHLACEDAGAPLGYGELWTDPDEREVELAHIIVAPDARGHGVGRFLVRALAERAVHPDVFLRVHPDNAPALRCYLGAGFTRVDPERTAEWNAAQPVGYVWLAGSPATGR